MDLITLDEVDALIRREMRGKQKRELVIDEETELRELGLSSLQIAEVTYSLEERHGLEFDPERAATVTTIRELIELGNSLLTGTVS